ncbi:YhgE/Pip domain-containing protein [Metasolibacillus sp.]|uniref:YhgE/Pip domain-containing protein n=1 Tax=Metasolibacillus sp. TaxID=2703680 RepID=UPI0025F4DD44|nr:YhgE/Pip domain-containing protein [Metasolibacillus sp.]MCT6924643.1 YhgE/Pip domain-containing protein [Metasolibacillus sp.]MCT6940845.1 YhgE/Pip domain-containing protein [Metasolibacillus sp.]
MSVFKSEWLQIFKTRKMLVSIVAVLFIPVLYSGMFLWAFWNPYAQLTNLPVAIVNEDSGANFEGETMHLGEELTDKLVSSEQFKFEEISAEDAEKQLQDRNYYMLIRIPENFSQHATTLLDKEPSKLVIDYIPNEGFNFLSAQIGETAMEKIKIEVNSQVSKTYAEKLFTSITKLGDGFAEAADGASKLDEGAQKLMDGAGDLQGYLEQLASSTIELADGTSELKQGAQKAATGATSLADGVAKLEQGSSQLSAGAGELSAGAKQLAQGINNYTDGAAKVAEGQNTLVEKQQAFNQGLNSLTQNTENLQTGASQLSESATKLNAGIGSLSEQMQQILATLPEEQAASLQATLKQLNEGSTQLASGLNNLTTSTGSLQQGAAQLNESSSQLLAAQQQISAGANDLVANSDALRGGIQNIAGGNATMAEKLNELTQGAGAAKKGANELATGLNTLVTGSGKLNDGTSLLAEKSGELAEGSTTLADGTKELAEGTETLTSKLQDASEEAKIDSGDANYEMVAQPVDVDKTVVNHVPNYGTGFAPYFISLGLFVGALLISIVFPFVEPAVRPTNPVAWFFSKVSVLAVVGIIQSAITIAIVVGILGLEVDSLPWFIVTTVLTSFTFLAIVQMLVSIMGDPGRFVAILILIIQLTTSAGTFPLELVPMPLRAFNPFFPMTYSVQAFKVAISTGDGAFLGFNFAVLAGFTLVCLAITLGYFALVFTRRYSKQQQA